tara:strand:+ start:31 stop:264 length:234 start_codon:yes stop_codon:yes gene_type:complete
MNVATQKQMKRLNDSGDGFLILPCLNAADAINDIMNVWGNQSSATGNEIADRLRQLADIIDGQDTQSHKFARFTHHR